MYIEGIVKIGTRTKELVKFLSADDIAVIQHDDIDAVAAESLINAKVKAVINTGKSMTGNYFSRGTSLLVRNRIKLYDTNLNITLFKDNDTVRIKGSDLIINSSCLYSNSCYHVNNEYIKQKSVECGYNHHDMIKEFVENTLQYAEKEKQSILNFSNYPDSNINMNGRSVVVVVRSSESKEALQSLSRYIEVKKPVLIGVDGGADTLISCGYAPDILIGDMDSVSDVGIFRSREIILHAYSDGRCPCLERMKALNVRYKILAMPGTSEDVSLLFAYDKGAAQIILIGGHNCMTDFLERGRKGMGSTLITRLKIEDRLIDYKHITKMQEFADIKDYLHYSDPKGELLWMKM